jgi:hypothetical protein
MDMDEPEDERTKQPEHPEQPTMEQPTMEQRTMEQSESPQNLQLHDKAASAPSTVDDDLKRFFTSWAWKREHRCKAARQQYHVPCRWHPPPPFPRRPTPPPFPPTARPATAAAPPRPDKERFTRPYVHKMLVDGCETKLTIHQAKFTAQGFASTGEPGARPSRQAGQPAAWLCCCLAGPARPGRPPQPSPAAACPERSVGQLHRPRQIPGEAPAALPGQAVPRPQRGLRPGGWVAGASAGTPPPPRAPLPMLEPSSSSSSSRGAHPTRRGETPAARRHRRRRGAGQARGGRGAHGPARQSRSAAEKLPVQRCGPGGGRYAWGASCLLPASCLSQQGRSCPCPDGAAPAQAARRPAAAGCGARPPFRPPPQPHKQTVQARGRQRNASRGAAAHPAHPRPAAQPRAQRRCWRTRGARTRRRCARPSTCWWRAVSARRPAAALTPGWQRRPCRAGLPQPVHRDPAAPPNQAGCELAPAGASANRPPPTAPAAPLTPQIQT